MNRIPRRIFSAEFKREACRIAPINDLQFAVGIDPVANQQ